MEWQLVLRRESSGQEILVRVESATPLPAHDLAALAGRVQESIHGQIGLRVELQIVDGGTLAPVQSVEGRVKTRRVVEE
jgi:phenylacetate-coenzyme A ligase PaaK-like adenylate-forming protein